MEKYRGGSGIAGVTAFSVGKDYIRVRFRTGPEYIYDYEQPGKAEVEEMKRLARKGKGLTTYINQFVRERYAKKIE